MGANSDTEKSICFCKHPLGRDALSRLISWGAPIELVVVQASERGKPWYEAVAQICDRHGIDLVETNRLSRDESCIRRIEALQPKFGFSIMFTQVIPPRVIDSVSMGIVNFHPALLPRYRGPHPVNWAIIRGEAESGVTAHLVTPSVDGGPIIRQDPFPILPHDTNLTLQAKIDQIVFRQVEFVLRQFLSGHVRTSPQFEGAASYFPARTPEDGKIRWRAHAAEQVRNLTRALQFPLDGAFTYHRGERLVVRWCEAHPQSGLGFGRQDPGTILLIDQSGVRVACIDGVVRLTRLEDSSGRPIFAPRWESHFSVGETFQT